MTSFELLDQSNQVVVLNIIIGQSFDGLSFVVIVQQRLARIKEYNSNKTHAKEFSDIPSEVRDSSRLWVPLESMARIFMGKDNYLDLSGSERHAADAFFLFFPQSFAALDLLSWHTKFIFLHDGQPLALLFSKHFLQKKIPQQSDSQASIGRFVHHRHIPIESMFG
jgi:hypothetical protein